MNYILVDKVAIEEPDVIKWAMSFEQESRRVASETINGVKVSTVFLGIDHQFDDGPPLLFETMVFGGDLDEIQDRCSTWDQAEEMHHEMCKRVRESQ